MEWGGGLQLLYIWLEEASKCERLDVCSRYYSLCSLFPLSLQAAYRGAVTYMPSVTKPLRHTCAPREDECQLQQLFRQSLQNRQTLCSRVDCQIQDCQLQLLRSVQNWAMSTNTPTSKDIVYFVVKDHFVKMHTSPLDKSYTGDRDRTFTV